jgi:hypothetical protein
MKIIGDIFSWILAIIGICVGFVFQIGGCLLQLILGALALWLGCWALGFAFGFLRSLFS